MRAFKQYQASLSMSNESMMVVAARYGYTPSEESMDYLLRQHNDEIQTIQIYCNSAIQAIGGELTPEMFRRGNYLKEEAELLFERLHTSTPERFKTFRFSRKSCIDKDEQGVEQLYYCSGEDKTLIHFPSQYAACKEALISFIKTKLNHEGHRERSVKWSELRAIMLTDEDSQESAVTQLWSYWVQTGFAKNPSVLFNKTINDDSGIQHELKQVREALCIETLTKDFPPFAAFEKAFEEINPEKDNTELCSQYSQLITTLNDTVMEAVKTSLGSIATTPNISISNESVLTYFKEQNIPPVIFDYIRHGRIFAVYGENPLTVPATYFPGDPFFGVGGWVGTGAGVGLATVPGDL